MGANGCKLSQGFDVHVRLADVFCSSTDPRSHLLLGPGTSISHVRSSAAPVSTSHFSYLKQTFPSFASSTKVFHRICNIPRNPIVLVPHPPSTFSPIFVPTALRVPGDLARLTWAVLAPPPTALTLSLLRRMSLSPLFSFHADSPEYWRTQDELLSHVDHIYATILEDERYDDRTKDRAWTILRAVSTFEQFVVQAVFLGHGVVERAVRYMREGQGWERSQGEVGRIWEVSRRRLGQTLTRVARRLRFVVVRSPSFLCAEEDPPADPFTTSNLKSITTNLAEMFYFLELFTSNVMLLGASLGDHIRRLPPEERQWWATFSFHFSLLHATELGALSHVQDHPLPVPRQLLGPLGESRRL